MPDVVYAELAPVTVYATDGVAPGVGPENVSPTIGPLIDRLDRALAEAGRRVIEPGIFWYEPADGHVPGPDWVTELQVPVAR